MVGVGAGRLIIWTKQNGGIVAAASAQWRHRPDGGGPAEEDLKPVDQEGDVPRRDVNAGHIDPHAIEELPVGRQEVGAEAGDRLVDGFDGMVADLGLTNGGAVGGPLLDVGRRGAGR